MFGFLLGLTVSSWLLVACLQRHSALPLISDLGLLSSIYHIPWVTRGFLHIIGPEPGRTRNLAWRKPTVSGFDGLSAVFMARRDLSYSNQELTTSDMLFSSSDHRQARFRVMIIRRGWGGFRSGCLHHHLLGLVMVQPTVDKWVAHEWLPSPSLVDSHSFLLRNEGSLLGCCACDALCAVPRRPV